MRWVALVTAAVLAGAPVLAQTGDGPVWTVTDVDGRAVTAAEGVTLALAAGRIAGRSGCNRFTGDAALTAASPVAGQVVLGALAGTRMLCPPDAMALERAVLGALARVDGWRIGPDGTLGLTAGDAVLIRARRD